MSTVSLKRLSKSFSKSGIHLTKQNGIYRVSRKEPGGTIAEILLPFNFLLEKKAVLQLMDFAQAFHPDGGEVKKAIATPDFHSGSLVPVGAVVATTDMILPQAIGTDIHCGMRLHVANLPYDIFLRKKHVFIEKLKGDVLFGTRDLPMHTKCFDALFNEGIEAWIKELAKKPLGQLKSINFSQLEDESKRIFKAANEKSNRIFAPDYLINAQRDIIRDNYLATLGGGNHFLEMQIIEEIFDKKAAFEWGIKKNQLSLMIHTGSRGVGLHVGNTWANIAKNAWPKDLKSPRSGIYPLRGELANSYFMALNTASNYAKLNRLLIAEMARARLREVFGKDMEIPLIFDAPHNIITQENDCYVHRKGATPAYLDQPVLIPGSMGTSSFLMKGLGNNDFMQSASHGAGRALSRFDISREHKKGIDIGLGCVECITLKEERKIEEAPMAYKEIDSVIDVQKEHGIVSPVARLKPVLTFKG